MVHSGDAEKAAGLLVVPDAVGALSLNVDSLSQDALEFRVGREVPLATQASV